MGNQEAEWLTDVRQGNETAFASLVEKYQMPVYNLCYRMLGDRMEAEDAAQESFWKAYQAIHRYDPNRSFATWLLSIAAHYCIDLQRKRKLPSFSMELVPEDSIPGSAPNPEKVAARTEQEARIQKILEQLKPQDRAAIILRYWHELSDEEIANMLSLSVSAVKSRLFRARKKLAEIWLEEEKSINSERKPYESPAF